MASTLLTALLLSTSLVNDNFPGENCRLSELQLKSLEQPLRDFFHAPNLNPADVTLGFGSDVDNFNSVCNDSAVLLAAEALKHLTVAPSSLKTKSGANENMQIVESNRKNLTSMAHFYDMQMDRRQDHLHLQGSISKEANEVQQFSKEEEDARTQIKVLIGDNEVEGAKRVFTQSGQRREAFTQQTFVELFDQQWQKKTIGRVYDFAAAIKSVAAFDALRQHQQRQGLFQEQPLLLALFSRRLLDFTRSADFEATPIAEQGRAYALAREINADRRRAVSDMVRELVDSEEPSGAALSLLHLIAAPPAAPDAPSAPELINEAVDAAAPYLQADRIGVAKFAEMIARRDDTICQTLSRILGVIGNNASTCQTLQLYQASLLRLPSVRESSTAQYFETICEPLLANTTTAYLRVRKAPGTDANDNINCLLRGFKEGFVFYFRHKVPTVPTITKPGLEYALQQSDLTEWLRRLYDDIGVTQCHLYATYLDALREAHLAHSAALLVTVAQAERRRVQLGAETPEGVICTRAIEEAPLWARQIVWKDPSQRCNISSARTGDFLHRDASTANAYSWNITFDELGRSYLEDGHQEFIEGNAPDTQPPLYRLFSITDEQSKVGYIKANCNCDEPNDPSNLLWKIDCSARNDAGRT